MELSTVTLSDSFSVLNSPEQSQSQVSSTLLLPTSFERTEESLGFYLRTNAATAKFLRLSGIIWYDHNASIIVNMFQYIWNIFVRAGLIFFVIFGAFTEVDVVAVHDNKKYRAASALLLFTGLLQVVAMTLALVNLSNRLKRKDTHQCILYLQGALNESYTVLIISLCIGISPVIYAATLSDYKKLIILVGLGEVSICCVLTATLYFICTDCKIASVLLDQLLEQQKNQLLTFEQFTSARSDIKRRHKDSLWINNAIVVVAFLDILSIVAFIYILAGNQTVQAEFFYIAVYLKEIPFLMVVYWEVSQVNEKAALFMRKIANTPWEGSLLEKDRKNIILSAICDPIEFTLAGMKLKRVDLIWQFAAYCIALVVSIVKSAISHSV